MYQHHFALRHYPFEPTLASDQLFDARQHKEARARVRHLIDLRGIGLMTGEAGCGKSTLCREITDGLHGGLYRTCYVSLTTGSVLDTYNAIAATFGLEATRTRFEAYQGIRAEVSRQVAEEKKLPILILDEAHHLRNDILEELRLLTNFRMDSDNRLCLLLVGLTELRRRLAMSAHVSLNQRVVMRCHLGGFERDEIQPYLEHRLELAGAAVQLFEDPAVEAIANATSGIPRRIDRIAHFALHAAAADKARTVSAEHVERAAGEIGP